MSETVIRPTMKFIRLGYLAAAAFVAAVGVYCVRAEQPAYIAGFSMVVFLWPLSRHLRRQNIKAILTEDKLRYEVGALSRSTRTIQLAKVQDVRVDQTIGQRIAGVGDVSVETSGETSRLTLTNIDAPQQVADRITEASKGEAERGQSA